MVVADTPAIVTGKGLFNLLPGWRRVFIQQGFSAQYDTGSAEPALKSGGIDKRLLERVQLAGQSVLQSFYRNDGGTVAFHRERHAGEDSLAVYQHGTGPAGTMVAGYFCTGKPQHLAERVHQSVPRLDVLTHHQLFRLSVNGQPDEAEFRVSSGVCGLSLCFLIYCFHNQSSY